MKVRARQAGAASGILFVVAAAAAVVLLLALRVAAPHVEGEAFVEDLRTVGTVAQRHLVPSAAPDAGAAPAPPVRSGAATSIDTTVDDEPAEEQVPPVCRAFDELMAALLSTEELDGDHLARRAERRRVWSDGIEVPGRHASPGHRRRDHLTDDADDAAPAEPGPVPGPLIVDAYLAWCSSQHDDAGRDAQERFTEALASTLALGHIDTHARLLTSALEHDLLPPHEVVTALARVRERYADPAIEIGAAGDLYFAGDVNGLYHRLLGDSPFLSDVTRIPESHLLRDYIEHLYGPSLADRVELLPDGESTEHCRRGAIASYDDPSSGLYRSTGRWDLALALARHALLSDGLSRANASAAASAACPGLAAARGVFDGAFAAAKAVLDDHRHELAPPDGAPVGEVAQALTSVFADGRPLRHRLAREVAEPVARAFSDIGPVADVLEAILVQASGPEGIEDRVAALKGLYAAERIGWDALLSLARTPDAHELIQIAAIQHVAVQIVEKLERYHEWSSTQRRVGGVAYTRGELSRDAVDCLSAVALDPGQPAAARAMAIKCLAKERAFAFDETLRFLESLLLRQGDDDLVAVAAASAYVNVVPRGPDEHAAWRRFAGDTRLPAAARLVLANAAWAFDGHRIAQAVERLASSEQRGRDAGADDPGEDPALELARARSDARAFLDEVRDDPVMAAVLTDDVVDALLQRGPYTPSLTDVCTSGLASEDVLGERLPAALEAYRTIDTISF